MTQAQFQNLPSAQKIKDQIVEELSTLDKVTFEDINKTVASKIDIIDLQLLMSRWVECLVDIHVELERVRV